MIITDFSQIALAAIHVDSAAQQVAREPNDENKNFIKHFFFNSIRFNFVKHKAKYGQMVIATDSNKGYWRRDFFEHYKIQRRTAKKSDDSGIDWKWMGEIIDETINDLDMYFKFPVIRVPKAEGDDIIGTLVKHLAENPVMSSEDIFGDTEPEPILIISSDRDNSQLHKFKNVQQWSPRDKKLIRPEEGWRKALIEKIVKGESGASSDSIPNIRTPDDFFATAEKGSRQQAISQKRLEEFFAAKNLEDACINESEVAALKRNRTLVDYEYIPAELQSDILTVYNQQLSKKHSKMEFMNYLTRNQFSNLLGNISDFYI